MQYENCWLCNVLRRLKWILGQSDFHRSLISHFLSQYVMMKTRHKEIRNQMKLVEIILTWNLFLTTTYTVHPFEYYIKNTQSDKLAWTQKTFWRHFFIQAVSHVTFFLEHPLVPMQNTTHAMIAMQSAILIKFERKLVKKKAKYWQQHNWPT